MSAHAWHVLLSFSDFDADMLKLCVPPYRKRLVIEEYNNVKQGFMHVYRVPNRRRL